MTDALPVLSVVMPVRNGATYLELAVRSILEQTFADFEFIIIDDGSSDQTPMLLSSLAKSDARIRLLRTSGEGIVVALNAGIRAARGALIARMDADDIAYPEQVKPAMRQGAAFFTLLRNFVVTGFYTTQVGFNDLGYVGNRPNTWEGVPEEVLKQYGVAYD